MSREASVGRNDGTPLGAALYLTAADLRELGADLDGDSVTFYVEDGQLVVQ